MSGSDRVAEGSSRGHGLPLRLRILPSTLAEDGDPIDVLLLMDEPAFPGCVLEARLIRVLEGEDELEDCGTQRNDRLLGVAETSHVYGELQNASDLPESVLHQMQDFFASYPRVLKGKTYKLLGARVRRKRARSSGRRSLASEPSPALPD